MITTCFPPLLSLYYDKLTPALNYTVSAEVFTKWLQHFLLFTTQLFYDKSNLVFCECCFCPVGSSIFIIPSFALYTEEFGRICCCGCGVVDLRLDSWLEWDCEGKFDILVNALGCFVVESWMRRSIPLSCLYTNMKLQLTQHKDLKKPGFV